MNNFIMADWQDKVFAESVHKREGNLVMAAAADNQVLIEKHEEDGRTVMNAHILGEDERVEEIARLIAGDKAGETTLRQAEEMLAQMRQ